MIKVIKLSIVDKELKKYPSLYINNVEEAVHLAWDDYDELTKLRQRLLLLAYKIEHRQGEMKYKHTTLSNPVVLTPPDLKENPTNEIQNSEMFL